MFCTKCGNKLKDDFNFCNECGAKISAKEHEDQSIEKIKKHLEFLGYKVINSATNDNASGIMVKKESDPIINFFPIVITESDNQIAVATMLKTKIKEENSETDLMLKETNSILFLFKSFFCENLTDETDKNLTLNFLAIFAGEYSKEKFLQFIERLEDDLRHFVEVSKHFRALFEE